MKAALFELDNWLGHQVYIFEGEDASEMLDKFEPIQDLPCLLRMGRMNESKKGQKQLDTLEAILDKHYSGELTMQDLSTFSIKLSIGAIKCSGVAETNEEVEAMKQNHPDAKCL